MAEVQRRGRTLPPSARGPPPPPPASKSGPRFEPVDREKIGGHQNDGDFAVRGKEPKDEVQIYTWMDATLRELTDLVKEVSPEARRRNAILSFALVYPDQRGRDLWLERWALPLHTQMAGSLTKAARPWANLSFR